MMSVAGASMCGHDGKPDRGGLRRLVAGHAGRAGGSRSGENAAGQRGQRVTKQLPPADFTLSQTVLASAFDAATTRTR